jgi:hypothetical protein
MPDHQHHAELQSVVIPPPRHWPAPTRKGEGGGEQGQDEAGESARHAVALAVAEGALRTVDELLELLATLGITTPVVREAREWRAAAERVLRVSGLTAESNGAAYGRDLVIHPTASAKSGEPARGDHG